MSDKNSMHSGVTSDSCVHRLRSRLHTIVEIGEEKSSSYGNTTTTTTRLKTTNGPHFQLCADPQKQNNFDLIVPGPNAQNVTIRVHQRCFVALPWNLLKTPLSPEVIKALAKVEFWPQFFVGLVLAVGVPLLARFVLRQLVLEKSSDLSPGMARALYFSIIAICIFSFGYFLFFRRGLRKLEELKQAASNLKDENVIFLIESHLLEPLNISNAPKIWVIHDVEVITRGFVFSHIIQEKGGNYWGDFTKTTYLARNISPSDVATSLVETWGVSLVALRDDGIFSWDATIPYRDLGNGKSDAALSEERRANRKSDLLVKILS